MMRLVCEDACASIYANGVQYAIVHYVFATLPVFHFNQ